MINGKAKMGMTGARLGVMMGSHGGMNDVGGDGDSTRTMTGWYAVSDREGGGLLQLLQLLLLLLFPQAIQPNPLTFFTNLALRFSSLLLLF